MLFHEVILVIQQLAIPYEFQDQPFQPGREKAVGILMGVVVSLGLRLLFRY